MDHWYNANTDYLGLSKLLLESCSVAVDSCANTPDQQQFCKGPPGPKMNGHSQLNGDAKEFYPRTRYFESQLAPQSIPSNTRCSLSGDEYLWSPANEIQMTQFVQPRQVKWTSASKQYLAKTQMDRRNSNFWSSAKDHFEELDNDVFRVDQFINNELPNSFGITQELMDMESLQRGGSQDSFQSSESQFDLSDGDHTNGLESCQFPSFDAVNTGREYGSEDNEEINSDKNYLDSGECTRDASPSSDLPVARRSRYMSATGEIVCVLCKRNGETREFYTTHVLKDNRGKVICPILRRYECPYCSATGDNAHTQSHCPVYLHSLDGKKEPPQPLHSRRFSSGRRRMVPGRNGIDD